MATWIIITQIDFSFYSKQDCPEGKHNCPEVEQWEAPRRTKSVRNPRIDANSRLNPFGTKIALFGINSKHSIIHTILKKEKPYES